MPPEEESQVEAVEAVESQPQDAAPQEAADVSGGAEAPQSAAPAQEQFGVNELWGAFKSLPQFAGHDDRQVAASLYEALQREQAASHALQQYQQLIPFASDYIRYQEPFQEWMRQRNSGAQPSQPSPQVQPQQPASWWNPPPLKDSYRQWLVRDESGREVVSPDAPFEAKAALTEHLAYKADFAKKFLENPESTLGPMVDRVAAQRAEEIVQQRITRMRDEDHVSRLEAENRDWLYGQNGDVSPAGLAVQKYIQDARTLGISGVQARWDYATKMVERDLMLGTLQQFQQAQYQPSQMAQPQAAPVQAPAESQAERNMQYLRQQAMRQPSQRASAGTDARVPAKPMTFAEKLAANLKAEGLI